MEVDGGAPGSEDEDAEVAEVAASETSTRKRTRASTASQAVPSSKKRKTLAALDAEDSDVPKSKGKSRAPPEVRSYLLLFSYISFLTSFSLLGVCFGCSPG